jgi:hypothetical protein
MIAIYRVVVGASCEELERHVNMDLLHPFTMPIRACHFASLIVTHQGYKAGGRPCAHICPLARTLIASSHPSLCLKREREKQREREREVEIGGNF